tara:strand:- start:259 stop:1707 length:1449 start_codon:yes stop_codon:yes gene_type:complete
MTKLGNTNKSILTQDKSGFISARVVDIILTITHPRAKEYGGYDAIGTIFWSYFKEPNQADNTKNLNIARPFFSFIKQYPLKNEIVLLIDAPSKNYTFTENEQTRNAGLKYYLPNVNIWNHQHNNALPDMVYHLEDEGENNYEKVGGTLIRTAGEDNSVEVPLGEYFKENLSIQPLLPFEGDTIVEGRFGNSIRLGATAKEAKDKTAYSTEGKTGDPITIIRNGALVEESDNGWEHTIENINSDHSTIYLTSNQVLPNMEIVSLHWQSWMAKHDELQVEQKDVFDNITDGFEVEAIEPEKPEETADQELEEATEEDIAAEEEKNEDPEDCEFWPDKEDNDNTGGEGSEQGYPMENKTNPHPKSPYSPVYIEGDDDSAEEESSTPSNPVEEAQPGIKPMPPNYGPETFEKEVYKGFRIMETNSRFDGIFMWRYEIEEKEYPAGSVQEYVQYENGRGSSNTNLDSLKNTIDGYVEEYDEGYRIDD